MALGALIKIIIKKTGALSFRHTFTYTHPYTSQFPHLSFTTNEFPIHFHNYSVDLRQFASSDLSLQSASPSHFQFMWTHSPLPHWNSPTGQRGFWGSVLRLQRSIDSSDLSLQSGSPSQLQRAGMHSESLQRNSC